MRGVALVDILRITLAWRNYYITVLFLYGILKEELLSQRQLCNFIKRYKYTLTLIQIKNCYFLFHSLQPLPSPLLFSLSISAFLSNTKISLFSSCDFSLYFLLASSSSIMLAISFSFSMPFYPSSGKMCLLLSLSLFSCFFVGFLHFLS